MAAAPPTLTPPAAVQNFNQRVGDLLKAVQPSEVVEILQHPASFLARGNNNNNNNNSRT